MDENQVAAALAEELRTNGELRRQVGMVEGSEMVSGEDSPVVWFSAETGETFTVTVEKTKD